jgi:hypothetical protein
VYIFSKRKQYRRPADFSIEKQRDIENSALDANGSFDKILLRQVGYFGIG